MEICGRPWDEFQVVLEEEGKKERPHWLGRMPTVRVKSSLERQAWPKVLVLRVVSR